jgi:flagellar basal body-associated protein FliL
MSEEETPKQDAPANPNPGSSPPRRGIAGALLGAILPSLLAGGAAFGAVRMSRQAPSHAEPPMAAKPPGPTLQLDPFLVTIPDANKKSHAMKVTIAIEFDSQSKEDVLKAYLPRIRDGFLGHLRTMSFEDALDQAHTEKLKTELIERARAVGVPNVERVLITDYVVQ